MANTLQQVTEELGLGLDVEESVSFGRFSGESLSWEKWSSFSQNKYMEEAEKCSTPGSVAKKAAYFEAHYKKICDQRAELLGQDKEVEADSLKSEEQNCSNSTINSTGLEFTDPSFGQLKEEGIFPKSEDRNCGNSTRAELLEQEKEVEADSSKSEELNCANSTFNSTDLELTPTSFGQLKEERISEGRDPKTNLNGMVYNILVEPNQDEETGDYEDLLDDGTEAELDSRPENLELHKLDVTLLVEEEKNLTGSQAPIELPPQSSEETNEIQRQFSDETNEGQLGMPEDVTQKSPNKPSKKKTTTRNEKKLTTAKKNSALAVPKLPHTTSPRPTKKNSALPVPKLPHTTSPRPTEKNSALPVPKLPHTTSPRTSKLTPSSRIMSATRTSERKNSSSLPRSKNPSVVETKRSTPTYRQLSLSLGSVGADSSSPLTTSRRSLIMEKMGDKEIVKRAFKTFQNSLNLLTSSTDEKSATPRQVRVKENQGNAGVGMSPAKEKEGLRKAVEKTNPQRGKVGARGHSALAGPLKADSANKSIANPASSSLRIRSEERAEKRKEFFIKLEKSNAKEVERTRLQAKSKEGGNSGTGTGYRLGSHKRQEKTQHAPQR
ncbi:neurofilament heavy protein isoform X2 [Tasmannia lanceolata]|uniref:neurofilament heavy protein isoform X2 n=1 Tax=Tasmannia lanceolata TaxID=3420 RepID=UPI0040639CD5